MELEAQELGEAGCCSHMKAFCLYPQSSAHDALLSVSVWVPDLMYEGDSWGQGQGERTEG